MFSIRPRAVDCFVEHLAASGEVGDDEAHIRAERGRLDARDHFLLGRPRARRIIELMKPAHARDVRLPAPAALIAPVNGAGFELRVRR